jgi:uncharacterized membrane protein YdbT with pleckstrin-like domain
MNSKTTTPPSAETSRWKGHTTHCIDFWYYVFSIVIALDIGFASTVAALPPAVLSCIALIVPVLMWLIRQWFTKCTSRELVAQRLKIGTGCLNRKLDELELFVVKDYAMDQPLFLRLAGLDIKTLVTRNAPPRFGDAGYRQDRRRARKLSKTIQSKRGRKRVHEMDEDSHDESVTIT